MSIQKFSLLMITNKNYGRFIDFSAIFNISNFSINI